MHHDRNLQSGTARSSEARPFGGWALAGMALVTATAAMVAAGCGSGEPRSAAVDTADAVVTVPAYETSREAHAMPAEHAVVQGVEEVSSALPGDGTMPPEIIVSASNTTVSPGEVIEIVVQATPDVTEMSLWDGISDRQALVYDADAKAWRVSYRVPLRLPWERTGLAITAKNEAQRWRRSWVFIQMQSAVALADTAGVTEQPLAEEVAEPGEH